MYVNIYLFHIKFKNIYQIYGDNVYICYVIIHEYPYLSAVFLILSLMATIFNYLGTFICYVKAFIVAFVWDIIVAKSTALNMVTFNTNLLDTC